MRRVVVAVGAVACAATVFVAVSAAVATAKVRAMQTAPFMVAGSSFHPGERVRVTVLVEGKTPAVRSTEAGARGAFTLRFAGLAASRCASWRIAASGNEGSRALARSVPAACGTQ